METANKAASGVYKGKVAHRSWPQLPEEIVRHIATFYLWKSAATNYTPYTWDARENWHPRMVYTVIRDAGDLEKNFMSICPQWHLALEAHLFWQQAVALVDPADTLLQHIIVYPKSNLHHTNSSAGPPPPIRLSFWRHFRNIINCSCIICRINSPATHQGLTTAKRVIHSPFLGPINICRDHDRRRNAFCGLCLREAPLFETAGLVSPHSSGELTIACIENEDEETWPHVDATCKVCRHEWLWRRVCDNPRDREAIGGHEMVSDDWETRQCVDGFLDLAEGSISDVISLAKEKWWLRRNTRLGDMLQQALAAARLARGGGAVGYGRDGDYGSLDVGEEEEEEEDDDEDDPELMQLTEESGVRDIALGDWARARILDGYWFSPADIWYQHTVPGQPATVPAIHPCPWTRERSSSNASSGSAVMSAPDEVEEVEEEHPKKSTIAADIPPSYALCEQAYIAHQRQMRVVLLPVLRNVVRRLVMECAASEGRREDPAVRAARMSMEDVLRIVREEEGVWYDGVDWAERRRNDDAVKRHKRLEEEHQRAREDALLKRRREDDSASSSEGSSTKSASDSSSSATSPVLSTTTLQTTPSPPPLSDEGADAGKKEDQEDYLRPMTIPVSPVLNPPRLLRPIPYVPVTTANMPHYSLEAFKVVWREACAPLYHCRCKICERAALLANAQAAGNTATPAVVPSQQEVEHRKRTVVDPVLLRGGDKGRPLEIALDEAIQIEPDVDGEGEEEVEYERREEEEEEEEDSQYEEDFSDELERYSYTPPSDVETRSRKRSSDELEDAERDGGDDFAERLRGGTPPKRARKGERYPVEDSAPESPGKLRKRSSEELEDEDGRGGAGNNKRVRVEDSSPADSPRTSTTADSTSDMSSVVGAEEEDGRAYRVRDGRTNVPRRVSQADLDRLYVLGDED